LKTAAVQQRCTYLRPRPDADLGPPRVLPIVAASNLAQLREDVASVSAKLTDA